MKKMKISLLLVLLSFVSFSQINEQNITEKHYKEEGVDMKYPSIQNEANAEIFNAIIDSCTWVVAGNAGYMLVTDKYEIIENTKDSFVIKLYCVCTQNSISMKYPYFEIISLSTNPPKCISINHVDVE